MTFDEWLDEPEGYSCRFERAATDMCGDLRTITKWLRAAYEVGYDHCKEETSND